MLKSRNWAAGNGRVMWEEKAPAQSLSFALSSKPDLISRTVSAAPVTKRPFRKPIAVHSSQTGVRPHFPPTIPPRQPLAKIKEKHPHSPPDRCLRVPNLARFRADGNLDQSLIALFLRLSRQRLQFSRVFPFERCSF